MPEVPVERTLADSTLAGESTDGYRAGEKQSVRKWVKERREVWFAETTPEERVSCVAAIWAQVESSEAFRHARTILLYASLPDELPTGIVLERWSRVTEDPMKPGKKLVLPLVEGESLRLKAYQPNALQPGYQGILEPLPSCPDVPPEAIDLAIVPGRAFTADGWRLGRGKGFYDRLLPTLVNAWKVGVAYPYQIVEHLPVDPWDVRLDAIYEK